MVVGMTFHNEEDGMTHLELLCKVKKNLIESPPPSDMAVRAKILRALNTEINRVYGK